MKAYRYIEMNHGKNKGNAIEKRYLEIEIDNRCRSYCDNMDELVVCPHCGKTITFGRSFTSRQICTEYGFGYAVCGRCCKRELAE